MKGFLIILLALTAVLLLRPVSTGTAKDKVQKEQPKQRVSPERKRDTAQPTDLARRIDNAIDQSELASARWGISVISMSDGSTLYQRERRQAFYPRFQHENLYNRSCAGSSRR